MEPHVEHPERAEVTRNHDGRGPRRAAQTHHLECVSVRHQTGRQRQSKRVLDDAPRVVIPGSLGRATDPGPQGRCVTHALPRDVQLQVVQEHRVELDVSTVYELGDGSEGRVAAAAAVATVAAVAAPVVSLWARARVVGRPHRHDERDVYFVVIPFVRVEFEDRRDHRVPE